MTAPFSFFSRPKGADSGESSGTFQGSRKFSGRSNADLTGNFPSERLVAGLLADSEGLASVSEDKKQALGVELGDANFQEFLSLAQESDPALLGAGLLRLAQRLADQDKLDWALKIYGGLKQAAGNPALAGGVAAPFQDVAKKAEAREQAILGQGAGGGRFEFLLKRFAKDATDYKTILPMMAGSFVGQLAETAVLGRLAGTARSGLMASRFAPTLVSAGAGYVPEFVTFALMNRAMAAKPEGSLLDDLERSALSIGALKLMGALGNQAFLRLHGVGELGVATRLTGLTQFNQFAISQSSVFMGMLLSHKLEERMGLRPKTDNGTFVTDTLTSMLSMSVGAHLGQQALGSRFARFQQELRLRASNSEEKLQTKGFGPTPDFALDGPPLPGRNSAPKSLIPPSWSLMEFEEGEKARALQESASQAPALQAQSSETQGERPPPPQFTQHLQLSDKLLETMEKFPGKTVQRYAKDEANAVHFGLNHLKWWMGLIQRDAGEWGAEAIVEGGKILFGRWPEQQGIQDQIEESLRRNIRGANGKLSFSWEPPPVEAWWQPLWQEAISSSDPAATKLLAGVLQRVATKSPELAEAWFQGLADRDIDRSVAVQELWEGPELSFKSTLPEGYSKSLGDLQGAIRRKNWPEVNRLVADLHAEVWDRGDLSVKVARVDALQGKFAKIEGPQPQVDEGSKPSRGPREIFTEIRSKAEAGEWVLEGPLWLQSRFGLPKELPEDLEEFESRLLERMEEELVHPDRQYPYLFARASFLHQRLGDPLKAEEYWANALSLSEGQDSNLLKSLQRIKEGKEFSLPEFEGLAQSLAKHGWDAALKYLPAEDILVRTSGLVYLAQIYLLFRSEPGLLTQGRSEREVYPDPAKVKLEFLEHLRDFWDLEAASERSSSTRPQEAALDWAVYGAIGELFEHPNYQESWKRGEFDLEVARRYGRLSLPDRQALEKRFQAFKNGQTNVTDSTQNMHLTIAEACIREGALLEKDYHEFYSKDFPTHDEALYLAKVLASLLPSSRNPRLSILAEKSLSAKLAELEAMREGLSPQQGAYVAAFLGFYFRCLGDETRSKEAWEELDAKLALSGADLDRGVNYVIQKLAGHEWPMDPPLGQAVIEAARRLRQGDVEAAMSLVDAAQGAEQKAHALAFLAKRLVPETVKEAVPASPVALADSLLPLKDPLLNYAKKRGELDQGLKMQGDNTGIGPALEWGYLAYCLQKLGEPALARKYFHEADLALMFAIHGRAQLKAQTKTKRVIDNLATGKTQFPVEGKELGDSWLELLREGKLTELQESLDGGSGPEHAAAMAYMIGRLEGASSFTTPPESKSPPLTLVPMAIGQAVGIGRSGGRGVFLVLNEPEVSRLHANLILKEEADGTIRLALCDNGSRNGTYVRGHRLESNDHTYLRDGDVFALGQTPVQVKLSADFGPGHYLALIRNPGEGEVATLQSFSANYFSKATQAAAEIPPNAHFLEPGDHLKIGSDKQNHLFVNDPSVPGPPVNPTNFELKLESREKLSVKQLTGITIIEWKGGGHEPSLPNRSRVPFNVWCIDKMVFGNRHEFKIFNEIQGPIGTDEVMGVVAGAKPNTWVMKTFPGLAAKGRVQLAQVAPASAPVDAKVLPDYFQRLPVRDLQTIPEAYRHLIPRPKDIVLFPRFQRILRETASLISAPDRIAVRFFGPPGTAKTTIPEMIAQKMGVPLLRVPFSRRTDPSDLEGLWSMEEVDGAYVPVFKEGAATAAMEHGFHLVLDEPDLARPGVLAYLNNVSAPGEFAWVRKSNGQLHRIRVHDGYRVYATENGIREIGREEHGKDFLRRFVPYYVGPWTQDEVTAVLEQLHGKEGGQRRWTRKVSQTLAYFHDKMRILAEGLEDPETRQRLPALGSGIGQQLQFTPRSVLRLAQRLAAAGPLTPESLSRAIRAEYILPLADREDRDLVWKQAQAIFSGWPKDLGWKSTERAEVQKIQQRLEQAQVQSMKLETEGLSLEKNLQGLDVPPGVPQDQGSEEGRERFQKMTEVLQGQLDIDKQLHDIKDQIRILQEELQRALDAPRVGPQEIPTPTLESLSEKYLGGQKIPTGDFVFTDQALKLLDEVLWNKSLGIDVMLLGDAGEGKTELPGQVAKLLGLPYYQKTVSSETDEEDLVGGLGRVNGKIQFIPDVVALGAKRGGIIHLEEFLLSETGKLEAVLSPLMDGARALILKNPYELIRRHDDAFVILTSNPPFGDFADRHESSGAAMSRVAVICLTDDFAMQPKDRLKILKSWMDRPLSPAGAAPAKKKILNPESTAGEGRRNFILPGLRQAAGAGGPGENGNRYLPLTVHPEVRDKFQLAANLVLDTVEGPILESKEDGTQGPLSPENLQALKKYSDYLTRRTQIEMSPLTGKVFKILYGTRGSHATSLAAKLIQLNLADLLERSLDASLGAGKHEWAHAAIDRPSAKYDAHEPGRLFANVVGDPRMNEYVGSLRQDFARQIDALCEGIWPKTITEEETAKYRRLLPHEQFAHAIIHYWRHGEIMPWIEEEKVLEALGQALPNLKPAFTLLPESNQENDVDAAARQFYAILDKAYPFYQALIPESLQQLMSRLERGEKPEDLLQEILEVLGSHENPKLSATVKSDLGGTPGSIPQPGMSPENLQQLAQKILDQRASQWADRFEPQDPEAFRQRKEQIAAAQGRRAEIDHENEGSQAPVPGEPEVSLTQEERKRLAVERQKALEEQLKHDLFRTMVPAKAIQAAQRLKKVLPTDDPTFLEGHFTTGKRMDRKKAVQEEVKPLGDGKVMLRRLRPGERDANLVLLSDTSWSVKRAGAVDNTLKASAAAIYLGEKLGLNYGEIVFGQRAKVAKPLGKPLRTYREKNKLLNFKKDSFDDEEINRGTNIREPLALALDWIRGKRARSNFIILMTDGAETVVSEAHRARTLGQLQEEAEREGIHLMVLAMGDAKRYVPAIFKHYRFVADDGEDIPDKIVELFSEAHRNRLKP